MRDIKQDFIGFRVSKREKAELEALAKKEGFDSISSFILWFIRKFKKEL